jgi:hypothetical protein
VKEQMGVQLKAASFSMVESRLAAGDFKYVENES